MQPFGLLKAAFRLENRSEASEVIYQILVGLQHYEKSVQVMVESIHLRKAQAQLHNPLLKP